MNSTSGIMPQKMFMKDILCDFFNKHKDELKYAKKGYMVRLRKEFEDETSSTCPAGTFRNILYYYRTKYDCPLQYVGSKYYKPSENPNRMSHYLPYL